MVEPHQLCLNSIAGGWNLMTSFLEIGFLSRNFAVCVFHANLHYLWRVPPTLDQRCYEPIFDIYDKSHRVRRLAVALVAKVSCLT